ncbi:hypothetical protein D9757_008349 [Collybiopsis confluens]|uniref:F-box domain-containing protein n=1 Tax=Collybiopsis confluens TaxID=2823264 RepID=A0A8H5HEP1_9AGAR|nr:hypothetical protein D9757_008349 [Collybiopsis confluens]
MLSLHAFSPEVLLEIFDGLPVEDVLNLSRVSHYLRQLSLCNRSFWTRADKTGLIPLPIGQTLKTIDISLIPQYFAQAVSISGNLQPKPKSGFSEIQEVQPKRTTEISLVGSPFESSAGFLRSAHLLPGRQLIMMVWRLSDEDSNPERIVIMSLDGKFRFTVNRHFDEDIQFVWSSEDNGGLTWLALLILSRDEFSTPSALCIFEIRCDDAPDRSFSVGSERVIQLPKYCSVNQLSMGGSLLVAFGGPDILVFDCQTGRKKGWFQSAYSHHRITLAQVIFYPSVYGVWTMIRFNPIDDDEPFDDDINDVETEKQGLSFLPLSGLNREPLDADTSEEEEWNYIQVWGMRCTSTDIHHPGSYFRFISVGNETIVHQFTLYDDYYKGDFVARIFTLSTIEGDKFYGLSRETTYEDDDNGDDLKGGVKDSGRMLFDPLHDTIYYISERSLKLLRSGARSHPLIPWKGNTAGGLCKLPFPEEVVVDWGPHLPYILMDDVYGQMFIVDREGLKLWLVQF